MIRVKSETKGKGQLADTTFGDYSIVRLRANNAESEARTRQGVSACRLYLERK